MCCPPAPHSFVLRLHMQLFLCLSVSIQHASSWGKGASVGLCAINSNTATPTVPTPKGNHWGTKTIECSPAKGRAAPQCITSGTTKASLARPQRSLRGLSLPLWPYGQGWQCACALRALSSCEGRGSSAILLGVGKGCVAAIRYKRDVLGAS